MIAEISALKEKNIVSSAWVRGVGDRNNVPRGPSLIAGAPSNRTASPVRPLVLWHTCTHLFEAGRHAPAAGLHDAVVPAHVLADLPVLLAPLLPASHDGRVAEERRDTVTGQSAVEEREGGRRGRDKAKR